MTSISSFSQWLKKTFSSTTFEIFENEEAVEKKAKAEKRILIMYKDNVYDVTTYMHNHPGGSEIILQANCKIVDKVFDKYHYPLGDAPKIMKKYLIGKIERNIKNPLDSSSNSTASSSMSTGIEQNTTTRQSKQYAKNCQGQINLDGESVWSNSYMSDAKGRECLGKV